MKYLSLHKVTLPLLSFLSLFACASLASIPGVFFAPVLAQTFSPTLLGSYNTPGVARGVYISDSIAYVADEKSGLQIINVSDPAASKLLGSYDTPGEAYGVYVSNGTAYVADGDSGLQIINVSDPATPKPLGNYNTPDWAYSVQVLGNTAYVAANKSGLHIINVSDPAAPKTAWHL